MFRFLKTTLNPIGMKKLGKIIKDPEKKTKNCPICGVKIKLRQKFCSPCSDEERRKKVLLWNRMKYRKQKSKVVIDEE